MASDFLLEIDGIKGESGDSKHKECVEVGSFSWGASNTGAHAAGGGGGTGKVNFHDISFTAEVNAASPELMLACAEGRPIKKAVLYVRKQGGGAQQNYYTITFEGVIVSAYHSGGGGKNVTPLDHFTLNFAKLAYEYKPQKEDQSLGSAVKTGWDLKTNKKHG